MAHVRVAQFALVPAVAHPAMVCGLVEAVAVCVIVAPASVVAPAVASAVGDVDGGAAEEEVVAARVAGVDGEVPEAVGPIMAIKSMSDIKQNPNYKIKEAMSMD